MTVDLVIVVVALAVGFAVGRPAGAWVVKKVQGK